MTPDTRLQAWLRLAAIDGLGSRNLHALLTAYGSPEAVLNASSSSLEEHVPVRIARSIKSGAETEHAARAMAWSAEPGNSLLTWDDADYPRALLDVGEAPVLLYYKGRRELLNVPALAIVGSRNASPTGVKTAEEFAEALASAGLTIISGMALGIDTAAHRGGLRAGPRSASTVAIIGTGIDRIYPPRNRELAHRIAEQGGILSEFPVGTPPLPGNFPRRNRLISGLARGVLVVEAALGSGSLITARLAGEQGRDVFAIPGSIHSPLSRGCHKLIREGAKLVETAQDVLEELKWHNVPAATASGLADPHGIDGDALLLLNSLGFDPSTPDELCARLGWAAERVSALLLQLELVGKVAQTPGGRVQRLA